MTHCSNHYQDSSSKMRDSRRTKRYNIEMALQLEHELIRIHLTSVDSTTLMLSKLTLHTSFDKISFILFHTLHTSSLAYSLLN
jgi:hypothetical protein